MKVLLLCVALITSLWVRAQNDPFTSYYMLNPTFYNPAWVGFEEQAHLSAQIRSQWTGYSSSFDGSGGAPNTQFLTAMVPVRAAISGVGITMANDNLGPLNNFSLSIPIAYKIEFSRSQIVFGLNAGVFSQTQKFDELRFNDPSDPLNIGTRETQVNFNVGAGAVYSTNQDFYIGVAAQNLTEPSFDYGLDSLQNIMKRSFNLISGFKRRVSKNLSLAPSVLVRSDLNSFTFDLSLMAHYRERGWAGLSYRWDEALVFMVGYSFLPQNQLKLGYAMDYILEQQDAKQITSQEIFLRYDMPELVFGGRKRIKTPRFTH